MPKFFTKYTPPKVAGFSSDQPSKVQEQFADACQTDTIIRKYNMMGVNPFISSGGSQLEHNSNSELCGCAKCSN